MLECRVRNTDLEGGNFNNINYFGQWQVYSLPETTT